MKQLILRYFCIIPVFLLAGCFQVGPVYKEPVVKTEKKWLTDPDSTVTAEAMVDPRWWSASFNDPQLDHLLDLALKQNLSLISAGLRVLQAQQQLAIAIGNQYPQQQQLSGSSSRQKANATTYNNYSLGFNIGWEADLWGRFRYQVESAAAGLDGSVAAYDGVLISLVSQVAQNYVLLRTNQQRLDVARENIQLQEKSLQIARAKLRAGEVSELDVDQAESLLHNTRASVPSFEASVQQRKNSLAILLGTTPAQFNELLIKKEPIPKTVVTVAVGMPQDLIRRRPDVRQAERQLAAQSANIGFAVTDLYPHLTIGGAIGTSSIHSSDLFTNDAKTWSLFGMFEWNIFNYGRLKSNVRLQDAVFQQLLVDYHNSILTAQGEVEDAIVGYVKAHEQMASYQKAAAASKRAVRISSIQYQEGAIPFNTLISTLESNLQQQDLLVASTGQTAANLVNVYKALGGGWEIRNNQDPVNLLPGEMKKAMAERTAAWQGVLVQ